VELVDDQPGHLAHVVALGQHLRQPRGDPQLLAQVCDLAGLRETLGARIGTVAPQRVGAPATLLRACSVGGLDGELTHNRARIGRRASVL
jgi:hypothetical protein